MAANHLADSRFGGARERAGTGSHRRGGGLNRVARLRTRDHLPLETHIRKMVEQMLAQKG